MEKAVKTARNKATLENTQRKSLLRVSSAYRTVPGAALQVLTAEHPMELLVTDKTAIHERAKIDIIAEEIRAEEREKTIDTWQRRWDTGTKKMKETGRKLHSTHSGSTRTKRTRG